MPDWDAEGLLAGLEGQAREARLRLLERLADEGYTVDEVRTAAAEGLLAFLLAEREVTGPQTHSQVEIAREAGLALEALQALRRTQGLPQIDPDARSFGQGDVELARTMAGLLDAGVPLERLLEIGRLIGRGLRPVAELMRATALEQAFDDPDRPEDELAEAFRARSAALLPFIAPSLVGTMRLHLREMVAAEAAAVAELRGGLAGAQRVAVAFADLTGFTQLGERLAPADLGAVAERLARLIDERAGEGVRVVKELGDGAMLVAPQVPPLLDTALALADGDPELPPVRVGLALGEALPRGGDWFGRPVNIASRICAVARPASVLATREVRDAAGDGVRWSSAGARPLKGVEGPVRLYRARRADASEP